MQDETDRSPRLTPGARWIPAPSPARTRRSTPTTSSRRRLTLFLFPFILSIPLLFKVQDPPLPASTRRGMSMGPGGTSSSGRPNLTYKGSRN